MTVEEESETCTLAGCEIEKGGHRQRNVVASKAGRGKATDYPRAFRKKQLCQHHDFSPMRPLADF